MPMLLLNQILQFLPAVGFSVLEILPCFNLGLLVSLILPLRRVGSSLKLSKEVSTILHIQENNLSISASVFCLFKEGK